MMSSYEWLFNIPFWNDAVCCVCDDMSVCLLLLFSDTPRGCTRLVRGTDISRGCRANNNAKSQVFATMRALCCRTARSLQLQRGLYLLAELRRRSVAGN